MTSFQESVIVALIRRMDGTQFLEPDELCGSERPQFFAEDKYLVVKTAENKETPFHSSQTNRENETDRNRIGLTAMCCVDNRRNLQ